MSESLQRGMMLVTQRRFDQAERELRGALGEDPSDPLAHAFLALCMAERRAFPEAAGEAKRAIMLAPDFPFAHYVLASVLHDAKQPKPAEEAIDEAIRLDPEDADYFALKGMLRHDQRDWAGALDAAEKGLHVDSEHIGCSNLRARALINLGRKSEANDTLDAALSKNPENAWTHANRGWALLEQSDRQRALEHFREALRLDPTLEIARVGIVEALKSKHLIYRLMLRYFLWSAKLSKRAGLILVVAVFFGPTFLRRIAENFPPRYEGLFSAAAFAIIAFALMTWIAQPLFDLLLRLNKFGRMALSREQIMASNYLGICLLGAFAALPIWLATRNGTLGFFMVFVFGLMVLPVSATFRTAIGKPRLMMSGLSIALAALGIVLIVTAIDERITLPFLLTIGRGNPNLGLKKLVDWFVFGVIGSTWISAGLGMSRR